MVRAILYGTLGCHLCDDAEVLLAPLLVSVSRVIGSDCEIECVDIADDDALLERYGEHIPVLRRSADGVELNWPFDADAAYQLLVE
ncbi:MAG: glutaredoxin family protein [Spongiibacteraceae bacterium]